jgi:hypothetical protein
MNVEKSVDPKSHPIVEVAKLELHEALKIGRRLAKYFVYQCSEGEHYVPLIDRLRETNTRYTFLEAIYILIRYGEQQLKRVLEDVSKRDIDEFFQFIRTGSIVEISQLYTSLSSCISNFELENMREQERYLLELLS